VESPADTAQLGPGLHVIADPAPLGRAKSLAAELGGDLCTTGPEAEELLAELTALPSLTGDALEMLRGLSRRVAIARRSVDGTVERAALEVGERLASTGSGMAIHPSAVRDRAAALVDALAALADAEAKLSAAEASAAAAAESAPPTDPPADPPVPPPPSPGPSRVAAVVDEPPAPRRRRFGWLGRRDRGRAQAEDTSESTQLLQQVAASTDEAFGARRATAARDDRLVLVRVQRDRALEDLRVAERAWRDLAGEGTGVDDVEDVVRRFDPQHQVAVEVAQETVGVRAVSVLLQRAVERWEEGWRRLGLEPPPAADQAAMDQTVDRLLRPVVLVAEAADGAELIALAAPAAIVVRVEEGLS